MQHLPLELRTQAPEACWILPELESVWVQAFRVAHKPVRGNFWSRPKVHRGFQAAWRNNSLHDRVIDRIKEIIQSGYIVNQKLRFHVTGGISPLQQFPPAHWSALLSEPSHRSSIKRPCMCTSCDTEAATCRELLLSGLC